MLPIVPVGFASALASQVCKAPVPGPSPSREMRVEDLIMVIALS